MPFLVLRGFVNILYKVGFEICDMHALSTQASNVTFCGEIALEPETLGMLSLEETTATAK